MPTNDPMQNATMSIPQHELPGSINQHHANASSSARNDITQRSRRRRVVRVTRTTEINSTKYSRPGRPRHAAWLELLYGTALYVTCIYLPSLPRYVYQTCIWSSAWMSVMRRRILWSIWICWRFSVVVMERWGWMGGSSLGEADIDGGGMDDVKGAALFVGRAVTRDTLSPNPANALARNNA